MSYTNHGGPAYPMPAGTNGMEHHADRITHGPQSGMTLRDYFAAQAMAGRIAGSFAHPDTSIPQDEEVAEYAYDIADKMLAERDIVD